jgi:hypothetical protein
MGEDHEDSYNIQSERGPESAGNIDKDGSCEECETDPEPVTNKNVEPFHPAKISPPNDFAEDERFCRGLSLGIVD